MTEYRELKSIFGNSAALDYVRALDGSSSNNPSCVAPNLGDYIADVELQAKRVLTRGSDWSTYLLFLDLADGTQREIDQHPKVLFYMKWKVGQELEKYLYPRSKYVKGKVVTLAA